jgi:hypothetical protein
MAPNKNNVISEFPKKSFKIKLKDSFVGAGIQDDLNVINEFNL